MQLNDKTNLKLLRAAIETALAPVGEHHRLRFRTAGIRFEGDGTSAKITLEVDALGENGEIKSKSERDFEQYHHFFSHVGLKAEHLHQTFKFNGEPVELVGLRPNADKFPLVVRNNATGRRFCVGVKLVNGRTLGGLTQTEAPERTP